MTVADLVRQLQELPQYWRVVIPLENDDPLGDDYIEIESVVRERSFVVLEGK